MQACLLQWDKNAHQGLPVAILNVILHRSGTRGGAHRIDNLRHDDKLDGASEAQNMFAYV